MKLSEVNLNDLDVFERECPHDMFEVLRREAPVFWQEEPRSSGYWAITKYEDLKSISRKPIEFSSERQGSLIRDPDPGALAFIQQVMLSMDPPKHRNYRIARQQGVHAAHGRRTATAHRARCAGEIVNRRDREGRVRLRRGARFAAADARDHRDDGRARGRSDDTSTRSATRWSASTIPSTTTARRSR